MVFCQARYQKLDILNSTFVVVVIFILSYYFSPWIIKLYLAKVVAVLLFTDALQNFGFIKKIRVLKKNVLLLLKVTLVSVMIFGYVI